MLNAERRHARLRLSACCRAITMLMLRQMPLRAYHDAAIR